MQINNNKNLRPKKIVSVLFKLSSVMRDENGKIEAVTYVDENGNYLHLKAEVRNPEFIEVRLEESYINFRKNSEIKNSLIQGIKPLNVEVVEETAQVITEVVEETAQEPEIEYSIPSFVVDSRTQEVTKEETVAVNKNTDNWKKGARKREEARQDTRNQLEDALRNISVLKSRVTELSEQLLVTTENYIKHRNEAEEAKKILNGEIDGMDVVVYKNNRS